MVPRFSDAVTVQWTGVSERAGVSDVVGVAASVGV
jgi:hypothetical protein